MHGLLLPMALPHGHVMPIMAWPVHCLLPQPLRSAQPYFGSASICHHYSFSFLSKFSFFWHMDIGHLTLKKKTKKKKEYDSDSILDLLIIYH